jgi:hypothetical protein
LSWTRHVNQLRSIGGNTPTFNNDHENVAYWEFENSKRNSTPQVVHAEQSENLPQTNATQQQTLRRSTRIRKRPDYLTYPSKK